MIEKLKIVVEPARARLFSFFQKKACNVQEN